MGSEIRALTFNCWNNEGPWRERWQVFLSEVKEISPNIIVFQEFVDSALAFDLASQLNFPYFVFPNNQSGLMIASEYPILSWQEVPYRHHRVDEEFNRSLQTVEVLVGERALTLMNTHLSWRPEDSSLRKEQCDEISEIVRAQKNDVLVFGDFNADAAAEEIIEFKEGSGLIDSFEEGNPNANGYTWSYENDYACRVDLPERRLDFIFYKGDLRLRASKTVLMDPNENKVFASDHFGVLSVFEVCDG